MSAFSNTGQDAIQTEIHIDQHHSRSQDIDEFYEIERTAAELLAGDYKRIALQFPDELLGDSVPVFRALKTRIGAGREIYVLADTSYGSCCVDEVAAQHVDADVAVHYGYACLSQTSRLPVIYVFGKKTLDLEKAASSLLDLLDLESRTILLKSDVMYSHLMPSLHAILQASLQTRKSTAKVTYTPLPSKTLPRSSLPSTAAFSSDPEVYSTIFYVGPETLALSNLLMTNSHSQIISYDPSTHTSKIESSRTNRMLMRRYAIVQKAKDADVFGILVGTLGVASYLPLIKHLRTLLAKHHKKSYTISVGKLNPAKLANFLEIECFVLVACPENSLIDAKEFYQPIVTPYELEIALGAGRSWDGKYILSFDQLLRDSQQGEYNLSEHMSIPDRGALHVELEPADEADDAENSGDDIDKPHFSLMTGKYKQAKRYGADSITTTNEDGSTSLVVRNQEDALTALPNSAALQFLHQRTYQGLEVRLGEDEPSVLEQGRSGIAKEYQTDHV